MPVYKRPPDLTDKPYFPRAEIEQGALKGKGLEIAYVQDPVALFEVQVQGSGRIALAEGGVMNLGFDGSNNRPYTAVGNVLLEMGVFKSKEEATWPAIRDWMKRNPQQARDVMRRNERYIFFKDTRTGDTMADAWARLRQCEASGNYRAVSPSGIYRGAYQFDQRTWESVGGSGDPIDAPPPEQDRRDQGDDPEDGGLDGPALADGMHVNPHDQRNRHRSGQRERAPDALLKGVHYRHAESRERDDHDEEDESDQDEESDPEKWHVFTLHG